MTTMFGHTSNPLSALAAIAGVALFIYAVAIESIPLLVVGLFLVAAGWLLTLRSRSAKSGPIDTDSMNGLTDEEYERQLAQYETGRRRTLPGQ